MLARSGVDNGGEEHMFSDFTDKLSSNGQNPAWFFRYGNNSFVTEKQQFGVEIKRMKELIGKKKRCVICIILRLFCFPQKHTESMLTATSVVREKSLNIAWREGCRMLWTEPVRSFRTPAAHEFTLHYILVMNDYLTFLYLQHLNSWNI